MLASYEDNWFSGRPEVLVEVVNSSHLASGVERMPAYFKIEAVDEQDDVVEVLSVYHKEDVHSSVLDEVELAGSEYVGLHEEMKGSLVQFLIGEEVVIPSDAPSQYVVYEES